MKLTAKVITVLLCLAFSQCDDNSGIGEEQLSTDVDNCSLEPETGPCKAMITRYYYDKALKKCKSFTWGGCQGVVPFETLEDCEKSCQ
jgi:hypothetical protein